jgi:hypothetical protein
LATFLAQATFLANSTHFFTFFFNIFLLYLNLSLNLEFKGDVKNNLSFLGLPFFKKIKIKKFTTLSCNKLAVQVEWLGPVWNWNIQAEFNIKKSGPAKTKK